MHARASSSYNTIYRNNLITSEMGWPVGVYFDSSSNNTVYQNNFVNNTLQVDSSNSTNFWDNACEGNYWSNYTGTDSDACMHES